MVVAAVVAILYAELYCFNLKVLLCMLETDAKLIWIRSCFAC